MREFMNVSGPNEFQILWTMPCLYFRSILLLNDANLDRQSDFRKITMSPRFLRCLMKHWWKRRLPKKQKLNNALKNFGGEDPISMEIT